MVQVLDSTNLKIEPRAETHVIEWGEHHTRSVFTALDSNKRLQLSGELIAAALVIARWAALARISNDEWAYE